MGLAPDVVRTHIVVQQQIRQFVGQPVDDRIAHNEEGVEDACELGQSQQRTARIQSHEHPTGSLPTAVLNLHVLRGGVDVAPAALERG